MPFCIVIALLSFIMRLWYVRKKQVHRQKARDKYLQLAPEVILRRDIKGLNSLLQSAITEFNEVCRAVDTPKVGIVEKSS